MSVEDSESRRFVPKIGLSFSQADVGPTSAPDLLFSGVSKSIELFFSKRAHWKRALFCFGGYL